MPNAILSPAQISEFHRDGYIIVRALFDAEEIDILRTAAKADAALKSNAYEVADGQGSAIKLALWNKAGENIYGAVARCPRIVDAMEQLLGDEVYHYHSKMSIKEPRVGGAWNWHQDYGYWYLNGCLFPDLASAFIAVDPNTRDNGCMQVLRGSHKLGRVEHGKFGDQTGADPERVEHAKKIMDLVYVELAPGDVVFFHSNTLHASDQNKSEHPRWSFICCYNTKHNNPYKTSHHPFYEKLEKVPDSRLKQMGAQLNAGDADLARQNETATEFWRPDQDKSLAGGGKTIAR